MASSPDGFAALARSMLAGMTAAAEQMRPVFVSLNTSMVQIGRDLEPVRQALEAVSWSPDQARWRPGDPEW